MFCLSILLVARMTGLCLGTRVQEQELLCPGEHSCSPPRNQFDHTPGGCSCEAACKIYGDCCRDSEHYDEAEQRRNVNEYMCVKNKYMKSKCSHNWNDAEVEALCLKRISVSDPRKNIPVTNTATNITYVNSYCAICNGENPNFLDIWEVHLSCVDLDEDIQYNLLFKDGEWGVILLNSTDSSFRPCYSEYSEKEVTFQSTIFCKLTINTCDDSLPWSQHVQSLCQSYSAAVFVFGQRFRNEHCASCNGYENDKSCYESHRREFFIPFSMILDFSYWSDSSLVGLTSDGQCGVEEVWDRISKKCRKVFCPEQGEKFRGKCVRG